MATAAPDGHIRRSGPSAVEAQSMPQQRPQVVTVGAGFGGLEAAKTLGRAPVAITLLDRQNYHCFQPLLYQVATAALSPAEVAWPIRHILRRQQNATVLMAEVNGIDAAARLVKTAAGDFPFDFLVVATGARESYFGHDEWIAFRPGPQADRRCHPHPPQPALRIRASRARPRRSAAAALPDLRGHRRRPHRRRDGRRYRRNRPADAGPRFPANRSAYGAHRADRGWAAPAAQLLGATFQLRA